MKEKIIKVLIAYRLDNFAAISVDHLADSIEEAVSLPPPQPVTAVKHIDFESYAEFVHVDSGESLKDGESLMDYEGFKQAVAALQGKEQRGEGAKEFHQNKCNSCGEPMSNDCPRCERLWSS
ncbi:hypothetical protein KAR91_00325 [Candidatus Pacearchaeota archaeon]|nr:hypothetical protein [Candidatus Pacearchaeota archaeon]